MEWASNKLNKCPYQKRHRRTCFQITYMFCMSGDPSQKPNQWATLISDF